MSPQAPSTWITRDKRYDSICVQRQRLYGGITAMLFSDCAFLNPGGSLRAALIATDLMREFIKAGVPVRMGIGKGTFYPFGYSTDTGADSMLVSKSRFLGTAVVRAHAAERCGGKGMRIFVHPKVDDLDFSHSDFKVLKLLKVFKAAKWELDYLHGPRPAQEKPTVDAADRNLFSRVAAMKDPKTKLAIRKQYIDTLKALNRMRAAQGRRPVYLRGLKYGIVVDN